MDVHFRCPACGRMLRVSGDKAGQSGKCPGCGEVVQIPAAEHPALKYPLKSLRFSQAHHRHLRFATLTGVTSGMQ